MKRLLALTLTVILAMTMITGCGSDNGGGSEAAKDSIVLSLSGDPGSIDPTAPMDLIMDPLFQSIYDPLLYIPLGSDEPVMCIAESYTVSDDLKEYTFKIRSDVKFHDGTDLKASDVLFSFQQANAKGAQEWIGIIDEMSAPDDTTFVIKLKKPYPPLLHIIYCINIFSEKAYTEMGAEAFAASPVGTGPYKFKNYEPNNKVELEAFDGYYKEPASIKNVTYRIFNDTTASATALEAGEIQYNQDMPAASIEYLKSVDSIQMDSFTACVYDVVFYDCTEAPFDNVKVRQAFNYAIDKEAMINAGFEGNGTPATGIVGPLSPAFNPDLKGYEYDLDKAAQLLEEAGYPGGKGFPDITITVGFQREKNMGEILQESLRKLGINAELEQLEDAAYMDKMEKGELGMGVGGMGADTIDGASFADYFNGTSSQYYSHYNNEEVNKLLDEALLETDAEKRKELYWKVWDITSEEAVCGPINWRTTAYGVSSDIDYSKAKENIRYYCLVPYFMQYK
ncbi:MAG: ABC transporter substrate-binding protein [Anaerovoracaceae bacterium]